MKQSPQTEPGWKNKARVYLLLNRHIGTVHRWTGLLLGVQVFLWMLSGVVMSWFSLADVEGETASALNIPVELAAHTYVAPGGIIAQSAGATDLTLTTFMGEPVYVTSGNAQNHMFNALTGEKISPLREEQAIRVANTDFAGKAAVKQARLMSKAPAEYRGPVPVWQIAYRDQRATRLYISPFTGKVISRRNRTWRIYDFFWMLHIMDYDAREDFNNPLLRAASATGLLFALSGIGLVILRLLNGRYLRSRRAARLATNVQNDIGGQHPEEPGLPPAHQ